MATQAKAVDSASRAESAWDTGKRPVMAAKLPLSSESTKVFPAAASLSAPSSSLLSRVVDPGPKSEWGLGPANPGSERTSKLQGSLKGTAHKGKGKGPGNLKGKGRSTEVQPMQVTRNVCVHATGSVGGVSCASRPGPLANSFSVGCVCQCALNLN